MESKNILLQTLPPEMRPDAEQVYDELHKVEPEPDLRDFVAELHRRGILNQSQLRETMLSLESHRQIDRVETDIARARRGYVILGPLGEGAMGEVLLAKDELGRVVAVKRLLPGLTSKKGVVRRFFKEAQITAQLDHPSIVPIHGLLDSNGSVAYAMKLVRGETLEHYIEKAANLQTNGEMDEEHGLESRLERFLHVCEAIAYAHDRGVVHRDLKPENVMVGAFGQVIVMDWGIAKLVARPEAPEDLSVEVMPRKTHQTRIGLVMGTPRYMSPEQASGRNDILDSRSDQYALGVMLQELVTLQPAVKSTLELEQCLTWARSGKRQPFVALHRRQPLPKPLIAIVNKACQLEPDDRYRSVGQMAEDIRHYLRDEPISAMRDSVADRLGRWMGHNRRKVMGLLMAVTLVGVTGVAATAVIGVSALGAAQYRASLKEERLAEILHGTNEQALRMDAAFRDWNGQLNGLAYSAERALSGFVGDATVEWDDKTVPPSLKQSKRYGRQVDLNWPDISAVDRTLNRKKLAALKNLVALGPQFRATLADSAGLTSSARPGAQRNAIEAGVPILWASVFTNDGYVARYPGMSKFKGGIDDFRHRRWYKERTRDRAIVWSAPHIDSFGNGLVVRASRTLSNERGSFLGMAAIEVSLQYVLDELMTPDPWVARTYLLDPHANVILSTEQQPATMTEYMRTWLPYEGLRKQILARPVGSVAVDLPDGSFQATWAKLPSTGWTFLSLVAADATPAGLRSAPGGHEGEAH